MLFIIIIIIEKMAYVCMYVSMYCKFILQAVHWGRNFPCAYKNINTLWAGQVFVPVMLYYVYYIAAHSVIYTDMKFIFVNKNLAMLLLLYFKYNF